MAQQTSRHEGRLGIAVSSTKAWQSQTSQLVIAVATGDVAANLIVSEISNSKVNVIANHIVRNRVISCRSVEQNAATVVLEQKRINDGIVKGQ